MVLFLGNECRSEAKILKRRIICRNSLMGTYKTKIKNNKQISCLLWWDFIGLKIKPCTKHVSRYKTWTYCYKITKHFPLFLEGKILIGDIQKPCGHGEEGGEGFACFTLHYCLPVMTSWNALTKSKPDMPSNTAAN